MCVYVCIRVCVFKPECVCEGLRTTLGSVHSFHRYLGSVQVARLMWQVPLPAEPTCSPSPDFELIIVSATSCVRCGAGDDALTMVRVSVSTGTKLRRA